MSYSTTNEHQSGKSRQAGNKEPIFPVIPANQAYLAGQTRYIGSSPKLRTIILVTAALVIGGLFSLIFGLVEWSNIANLEQNGVTTQATVINRQTTTARSSTSYYLVYNFVVPSNTPGKIALYTKEMNVSYDTYDQHPNGSSIKIIYLPADPNNSEIPNQTFPIGISFAGIFLVIGIIMGTITIWNWRLNRLLEQKGRLIPAQIVTVNPVRLKNGRGLKVKYSFTTPDGQTITRNRQLLYNAYTSNITPYTHLGVLYYDTHRYRLL